MTYRFIIFCLALIIAVAAFSQNKTRRTRFKSTNDAGTSETREAYTVNEAANVIQELFLNDTEKRDETFEIQKTERVFFLIFDYSGSMAERLPREKVLVRQFLGTYRRMANAQAALIAFGDCYSSDEQLASQGPYVPLDYNNASAIEQVIEPIAVLGGTDLYRALRFAKKEMQVHQFAEVILFSDEMDTCSEGNLEKLTEDLEKEKEVVTVTKEYDVTKVKAQVTQMMKKKGRVRVHVLSNQTQHNETTLSAISEMTGGSWVDANNPAEVRKFFDSFTKDVVIGEDVPGAKPETEKPKVEEKGEEVEKPMENPMEEPQREKEKARSGSTVKKTTKAGE